MTTTCSAARGGQGVEATAGSQVLYTFSPPAAMPPRDLYEHVDTLARAAVGLEHWLRPLMTDPEP
jgi:hypothetical protein